MLCTDDLLQINEFFQARFQKTLATVRGSDNPKIVNYKIRAFIEKIRDNLKNYEPISITTMATVS